MYQLVSSRCDSTANHSPFEPYACLSRIMLPTQPTNTNQPVSLLPNYLSPPPPQALRALDQVFGSTLNSKGFKVIQGAGGAVVGVVECY